MGCILLTGIIKYLPVWEVNKHDPWSWEIYEMALWIIAQSKAIGKENHDKDEKDKRYDDNLIELLIPGPGNKAYIEIKPKVKSRNIISALHETMEGKI